MSAPISAQAMVPLVAAKIDNRALRTWSPTQTLAAIDAATQALVILEGEQKKDHELDYMDLVVATETAAGRMGLMGQDILEWRLPEIIRRLRLIEDTTDPNAPREIPFSPLELKETERETRFRRTLHFWVWGKGSKIRPRVAFVGALKGARTIRCWYVRRCAPLHYGTAKSGLIGITETASTSARIQFDLGASGAGTIVNRPSVYDGSMVQIGTLAGTSVPGVTDSIRTLNNSAWVFVDPAAAVPVLTHIFDETLNAQTTGIPTYPCASMFYSLIAQVDPEHHELVILMAAVRQAEEAGAMRTLEILGPKMEMLLSQFVSTSSARQIQEPEFIQSRDIDQ